jgi:hypothetical protein
MSGNKRRRPPRPRLETKEEFEAKLQADMAKTRGPQPPAATPLDLARGLEALIDAHAARPRRHHPDQ